MTHAGTYEVAPVGLVQLVLHRLKDELRVRGRASEGRRQDRQALQIEDLRTKVSPIRPRRLGRTQSLSGYDA
jgi:hypothetical protein